MRALYFALMMAVAAAATSASTAHAVGAGCSGTIAHLWAEEDGSVYIRLSSSSCGCAVTYTLEGPTYYVFKMAGTQAGSAKTHATALAAKIANKTVQVWYEETGTEPPPACLIHNVALLTQ